jgi:hypothetical protein
MDYIIHGILDFCKTRGGISSMWKHYFLNAVFPHIIEHKERYDFSKEGVSYISYLIICIIYNYY